MGVASSSKVVTSSEGCARPELVQPGDREWVTVIQGIVHISAWYEEIGTPKIWKLSVSENGWTNSQLGFEWLQHFDAHTKARKVGGYRLLIMDGHESHLSQKFKDYCLKNNIITLCMPPHSWHILQPLDLVCFSPLKRKYLQCVQGLARRRVFHVDKEGFLPAFRDAFFDVFNVGICQKAFEAAGLVHTNSQEVLDRLQVHFRTPSPPLAPATQWESRTPSNTHEFGFQSKLVSDSFTRSPIAAQQGFAQLVKGAEMMLHENALMSSRITEFEEQLEIITRRKARKVKRIQHRGTMEYGAASVQVAAELSSAAQRSKNGRGTLWSKSGVKYSRTRLPV